MADLFRAGTARVLVGTRSLLGEGWDCPAVNVTVDLTTAATATAITQMRGRSLRPDRTDPEKTANNWTVCCIADQHPRGDADYQRLVRKHDAYFAITAHGEVESGISHCDPALSPFVVPTPSDARAVTAGALERAGRLASVRAAWRIGEPFTGSEVASVRVRSARTLGVAAPMLPTSVLRPDAAGRRTRLPGLLAVIGLVASALVAALAVAAVATPELGVASGLGLAVAEIVAFVVDAARRGSRLAAAPSALERLAAVVADALHQAGAVDSGADAVEVLPTPDGWLRCVLSGVPDEQSALFTTALNELLAPLAEHRYLVGRRVVRPPAGRRGRIWYTMRALLGLPVDGAVAWHAIPRWCAANKQRRRIFLHAWTIWIGPARQVRADSADGQAILELFRGENPFGITAQMRTLWH